MQLEPTSCALRARPSTSGLHLRPTSQFTSTAWPQQRSHRPMEWHKSKGKMKDVSLIQAPAEDEDEDEDEDAMDEDEDAA